MSTHCPSPAQLLVAALAVNAPANELVARHIRGCASCRRNVAELRELLGIVRSSPPEEPTETPCLGDIEIARLIDGSTAELDGAAMRHLAESLGFVVLPSDEAGLVRMTLQLSAEDIR